MKCTLFSSYFMPEYSRKYGRRIRLDKARNFSEEKLEKILRDLNLNFDGREAKYPRTPSVSGKMYIVESNVRKSTLLKIIERRL